MLGYSESLAKTIRRAAKNNLMKLYPNRGRRSDTSWQGAESRTATSSQTTSKRAEHPSPSCAIGKQKVENWRRGRVLTVHPAANTRAQKGFFESECSASPQVTNLDYIQSYSSSDKMMNVGDISFEAQERIASLSANA